MKLKTRGEGSAAAIGGTLGIEWAAARSIAFGGLRRTGGTLAVIVSGSLVQAVYPALESSLGRAVGRGAAGLSRAVAVLTPLESKGLEFDAVVVVEPQRMIEEISRGAAALYVAMTRSTQRLHLVTTSDLPAGI